MALIFREDAMADPRTMTSGYIAERRAVNEETKKPEIPIEVALTAVVDILKQVAPAKRNPLLHLAMAEVQGDCGCKGAQ